VRRRPNIPRFALLAAGLGVLALAGCQRGQIVGSRPSVLLVQMVPVSPARLDPGTLISVTARPEPPVAMAWVSGTVQIFGAPVAPFRRGADGAWRFRTAVPPMVDVPPGAYGVKVWGRTLDGQELRGASIYEVE
jgi:hypothetical protein